MKAVKLGEEPTAMYIKQKGKMGKLNSCFEMGWVFLLLLLFLARYGSVNENSTRMQICGDLLQ